jgi:squalene-hopene/tetraprenyl-beta-curcumene cyclase
MPWIFDKVLRTLPLTPERLDSAFQTAYSALLAERTPEGYWIGELSTSALSTATAVSALALVQKQTGANSHEKLIAHGLTWLADHQNADGGWGDTVKSISNISTTMLCRAAFHLNGAAAQYARNLQQADSYMQQRYGKTPEEHAEAVRKRYGKDRTFAVPILTTCALAGLVRWKEVQALPFELACFPQAWFRFLRLHVVSYALPALIAIGQAVYHHRPPWNPVARFIRWIARGKSLRVLEAIQPSSGGFLEAVPLTSFVTLSLASIGQAAHPVARKAVEFLVKAARPDGSWPIDSNLATWVTTLSVNALAAADALQGLDRLPEIRQWVVGQQFTRRHPYTGAEPGGWGWTDLPGSVPDGDDTPGALLALRYLVELSGDPELSPRAWLRCILSSGACEALDSALKNPAKRTFNELKRYLLNAANPDGTQFLSSLPRLKDLHGDDRRTIKSGFRWLLGLQNRDGGWPTFCRGWGNLPFDRSGTDLTAHVLRVFGAWKSQIEADWLHIIALGSSNPRPKLGSLPDFPLPQIDQAMLRGLRFLSSCQGSDGSWLPLWFGNQYAPDDENPTYGTARVLAAYRDLDMMNTYPARRGVAWLRSIQNSDGGWGGAAGVPSSVEETALAVEILLDAGPEAEAAVNKGLAWLVEQVEAGGLKNPTPIGFYFAKLWYFEKLYPIIFAVAALGRARRTFSHRQEVVRKRGQDS